jgi:hypothetical protein
MPATKVAPSVELAPVQTGAAPGAAVELLPKEKKPGVGAEPGPVAKTSRRRRRRGGQAPSPAPSLEPERMAEPIGSIEPEPVSEPAETVSPIVAMSETVVPGEPPAPIAVAEPGDAAPKPKPSRRRRRPSAAPAAALAPVLEAPAETPALTSAAEPSPTESVTVEFAAVDEGASVALEAERLAGSESATPARAAPRRPRKRQPKVEEAAPESVALEPVVASVGAPAEAPEPARIADELPNILEAPAIGVEIVATEERQGTLYFTICDLRNCNAVHNVTSTSARKLWSYAISQYMKHQPDREKIAWSGDYGLWQVARRAKKLRYDLVKRQPDGSLRVFYGVTADGMDGPWAQFLRDEDRGA